MMLDALIGELEAQEAQKEQAEAKARLDRAIAREEKNLAQLEKNFGAHKALTDVLGKPGLQIILGEAYIVTEGLQPYVLSWTFQGATSWNVVVYGYSANGEAVRKGCRGNFVDLEKLLKGIRSAVEDVATQERNNLYTEICTEARTRLKRHAERDDALGASVAYVAEDVEALVRETWPEHIWDTEQGYLNIGLQAYIKITVSKMWEKMASAIVEERDRERARLIEVERKKNEIEAWEAEVKANRLYDSENSRAKADAIEWLRSSQAFNPFVVFEVEYATPLEEGWGTALEWVRTADPDDHGFYCLAFADREITADSVAKTIDWGHEAGDELVRLENIVKIRKLNIGKLEDIPHVALAKLAYLDPENETKTTTLWIEDMPGWAAI